MMEREERRVLSLDQYQHGVIVNPQTGDNSNMFLWIALLFVSGFGVVATTVIGKKKSSAK